MMVNPTNLCLVLNDTQVSTNSTEWKVLKSFRWCRDAVFGQGGKALRMLATLWQISGSSGSGTGDIRFQVRDCRDNSLVATSSTASSSECEETKNAMTKTVCEIAELPDGLYTIEVVARCTAGTFAQKYLEISIEC
jgi:hypothetical protein